MKPAENKELKILSFKTQNAFEKWLAKNHDKANGIWLRHFKKESGEKTISRKEALDTALCYGWIDAIANKYDDASWIQKYTPRRARSIWSKINIENIERLTASGKMQPAGLAQVQKAKDDGRWGQAYDSPSQMQVPDDFIKMITKNKTAKTFFDTLNKTNKYAIGWRLQTAKKPETRKKRMEMILKMLSEEKKFH